MTNLRSIALVTGRAGSKRLPGKHTMLLGGKPLIHWTVAAGLSARRLSRVIVSTDGEDIARAARHAGADVPFMRPVELAGDDVTNLDVMLHALAWLEDHGEKPDVFALLQSTSPFRCGEDIDQAIAQFALSEADSLVSVCAASTGDAAFVMAKDGRLRHVTDNEGHEPQLSTVGPCYRPNGAIYLVRVARFLARRTILCDRPQAYIMPESRSVDIDTMTDFEQANRILQNGGPTSE